MQTPLIPEGFFSGQANVATRGGLDSLIRDIKTDLDDLDSQIQNIQLDPLIPADGTQSIQGNIDVSTRVWKGDIDVETGIWKGNLKLRDGSGTQLLDIDGLIKGKSLNPGNNDGPGVFISAFPIEDGGASFAEFGFGGDGNYQATLFASGKIMLSVGDSSVNIGHDAIQPPFFDEASNYTLHIRTSTTQTRPALRIGTSGSGNTNFVAFHPDVANTAGARAFKFRTFVLDKDTFTPGALHSEWLDAGDDTILSLVPNGLLDYTTPDALGGGVAPTLGTIGGTGPAAAAQSKWLKIKINGTDHWLPAWV